MKTLFHDPGPQSSSSPKLGDFFKEVQMGIEKEDRVGVLSRNCPEFLEVYFACAKIGAVHSVVFSGFSAGSLRDRLLERQ